MIRINVIAVFALALFACDTRSAPASTGSGTGGRDTGDIETAPEDAGRRPVDDADPRDVGPDTFLADGFARPDVPAVTDTGVDADEPDDVDGEPDANPDVGVRDADRSDTPDRDVGVPDADEPDADEPDADEPDVDDGSRYIEGTRDCLSYEIFVSRSVFDFKSDDIAVRWEVRNICTVPLRFVMPHTNDLFPIAIEKDGDSWIWMPDCPGTGGPIDVTFDPGEGWSRGYIWSASDHESRVERCGVEYTRGAEYRVVGYGATPVDIFDDDGRSEAEPLSEPIVIDLVF